MRAQLLDLVCCPACGQALTLADGNVSAETDIQSGNLTCANGHTYPIQEGLPLLYIDDEKWASKAIEAEGWVSYHKELGIYEVVEDAVDLKIPYYDEEPWITVGTNFDLALKALNLTGNETVLDLGAGRGWAAKQFALKGCKVVALDIVTDQNIGLGRANAIMQNAGVQFDLVIGDGENLPFYPDQFDLIFCSATLHHSSNLDLLFANIAKVLKPGGRFCGVNEPSIPFWQSETDALSMSTDELEHGINETRPNLKTYNNAATSNGLNVDLACPVQCVKMSDETVADWAHNLGVELPKLRVTNLRGSIRYAILYGRTQLNAWRNGKSRRDAHIPAPTKRAATEYGILQWIGGALLFIVSKPPAS